MSLIEFFYLAKARLLPSW